MTPEHFVLLAAYNKKMNTRIYEVARTLSKEAFAQDVGAFFKSILGTLNHLVVADIFWLKRLSKHPLTFNALKEVHTWPQPTQLDQPIITDLMTWHDMREKIDEVITAFVAELTPASLTTYLDYVSTEKVLNRKPLSMILLHFFNHQTHHRGQISTLLFQAGVDVGVTDLLASVPNLADADVHAKTK